MDGNAKFWNKVADRYAARPVSNEAAYKQKLQLTREYLRPDMEVLEFGCGTGSTAIAHAPFVKHILAIDISERMLAIARDKATAGGANNITFRCDSIDDLVIADASFDVVMGHSILHLLEDKEAALAKVYRMLKPGGFFVSSTVCIGDTMKFVKVIAPIGKLLGLMPTVKVFGKSEMLASITRAGFTIDHEWRPEGKVTVLFAIAGKPATSR